MSSVQSITALVSNRLLRGLALGALVTAASIGGAVAAEKAADAPGEGTNMAAATEKPAEVTALRSAIEASIHADFARQTGNAAGLAAAAEAMAGAGSFKTLTAKPAETGGVDDETPKGETAPATALSLIAEAQALAGNDTELAAAFAAKSGAMSNTFGATGGPGQNVTRVRGYATHDYTTSFYGGELAEVGVDGDNDSDLDLYIYDQSGNPICASAHRGDAEYCAWYPKWTGPFLIRVVNRGKSSNVYWIGTN
jgi:hypothetical protein